MTHLGDVQFENVYPAVAECFVIMLAGYIAGRLNLISSSESKGLNIFVSHFSLPALIFMSLATLHLDSVNWKFLFSILIAKTVVFFAVGVTTAVVQRPSNFGKAALFAIFCTQSNDFALGYPIVEALYKKVHPEFSNYLYLVAPISLVFLNPIGFVLLEVQRRRQQHEEQHILSMVGKTVKNILCNPVVAMTICGVIGNFAFKQNVPLVLDGILKVLGSAFSATALFCLGLKMVGNISNLKRHDITVCAILIAVKILLLPLLIRETVLLVEAGSATDETAELSTYGFLYGTFPSAPGIFVFATQYNIAADLIATAVSGCTLLAAPFIFVSAKMISLHFSLPSDYLPEFQTLLFNVGIVSLVGCIWTLVVFLVFKKWRKMPHWITFCLLMSHLFISVSTLMWKGLGDDVGWLHHLQFFLFATGVYASRIWSALLALGILLLRWRSLCFLLRLKPVLIVAGWGIPLGLVSILYFMLEREAEPTNKIDPYFVYGTNQAVASSMVLFCCLCITILCLITQQRFENLSEYQSLLGNREDANSDFTPIGAVANESSRQTPADLPPSCHGEKCGSKFDRSASTCLQDVEDLMDFTNLLGESSDAPSELCDVHFSCPPQRRQECSRIVKDYQTIQRSEEESDSREERDKYEFLQHTVLLYMFCLSMFVGLAVCLWRTMLNEITGIYVELEFLDGILNVGQGFFIFAIFGTKISIFNKAVKWWKHTFKKNSDSRLSALECQNSIN